MISVVLVLFWLAFGFSASDGWRDGEFAAFSILFAPVVYFIPVWVRKTVYFVVDGFKQDKKGGE